MLPPDNRRPGQQLVNTLPTPARPPCHLNCRLTNHRPENLPPVLTNPPGRTNISNTSNISPDFPAIRPKPTYQPEETPHRPGNCRLTNQNQENLPPTLTNPPNTQNQFHQHQKTQLHLIPTKSQRIPLKPPTTKTPQQKRKILEISSEENLPSQKKPPQPNTSIRKHITAKKTWMEFTRIDGKLKLVRACCVRQRSN